MNPEQEKQFDQLVQRNFMYLPMSNGKFEVNMAGVKSLLNIFLADQRKGLVEKIESKKLYEPPFTDYDRALDLAINLINKE